MRGREFFPRGVRSIFHSGGRHRRARWRGARGRASSAARRGSSLACRPRGDRRRDRRLGRLRRSAAIARGARRGPPPRVGDRGVSAPRALGRGYAGVFARRLPVNGGARSVAIASPPRFQVCGSLLASICVAVVVVVMACSFSCRSCFTAGSSPRHFGRRGQPDCVEPVEGSAPASSPDDSTTAFIFRSPCLSTAFKRSSSGFI